VALFPRKSRVLLLDDDVSIQKLVATLLRREGYHVDVVGSGRRAIEAIGKNDYTALLLDLMMPTEGGMTVLGYLRETNPKLLQRVVLLTATPDPVLKTIAKDVFAVVKKPFKTQDLVRTITPLRSRSSGS
jgi:DNA-binding response OmpR family regulator